MKKLLMAVVAAAIFFSTPMMTDVYATEDTISEEKIVNIDASKPILALGADLSAEQKASVFSQMGITQEQANEFTLVTITNEMEHQYLGSYMDASVIGSRSLSSVLITPKESGHGVVVTTKNINYCTTGMYRNALLTAGVSDAEILVAAPSPMSGTAALIGAIKGYEAVTGEAASEAALDTAMDEMITTGEIADEIAELSDSDMQEVEELIAFVKAKVAADDLDSEEEIRDAIKEGEEKFGVALQEDHIQKIVEIMMKIHELGLDPQMLIEQAEDLYSKFGTEFINNLENIDTEEIGKEIEKEVTEGFLSEIINSIKEFFAGLFS